MNDRPHENEPYTNGPDENEPNSSAENGTAIPLEERPLAEVLGIEIQYAPDDLAPPVDLDRMRAFVRRALSADERKEVLQLIGMFHCWHVAWGDVLREGLED